MAENNRGKTTKIVLLLIIAIIILAAAYFMVLPKKKMSEKAKYRKVLVLGIDGLDPKIMKKLMGEGKLPNFKKLADEGSFMNLNTSYPPHSPVAWTSIATGTNPGKHNIFDFIRRNQKTHMPELSLSKTASGIGGTNYESYVKTNPFWRITTEAGIPTNVIRWPVTFPPERIEGNMLSGLGVPDIKGFLSGYTYYATSTEHKSEGSNKVVEVDLNDGVVTTEVYGPKTRKGGEVVDITAPMEIKISDDKQSATLTVDGKTHNIELNSWSNWIRAKFNVGMFKDVYGTFKAYLVSTEPLGLYVTTIQIDPENPVVDISYPSGYSKDLAGQIGLYYTLGMPEETSGYTNEVLDDRAMLSQIAEIEAERDKMFWEEFKEFKDKEGIYAFVYDSSDRLQHVFWDEKILEGDDGVLTVNPNVVDYIIKKDAFIGEVLKQIDDQTLLIIISDHGFTSFERSVSINTWLAENGFLKLTKDITEEDDGALFQYVDWSQTKAYSLGFNSIYVNVKGREGKGIVEDREKVVDEIIRGLEKLTDEKTGKKVINKAYRREEIYDGDYITEGPDIIVGFNPGYRMSWQNAIGGFTPEVITDNNKKWDGDPLVDPKYVPGVLFANVKMKAESASQMNVAPMVLDAVGIEIPKNMDGESLLE